MFKLLVGLFLITGVINSSLTNAESNTNVTNSFNNRSLQTEKSSMCIYQKLQTEILQIFGIVSKSIANRDVLFCVSQSRRIIATMVALTTIIIAIKSLFEGAATLVVLFYVLTHCFEIAQNIRF